MFFILFTTRYSTHVYCRIHGKSLEQIMTRKDSHTFPLFELKKRSHDELREWARGCNFCVLIGYSSGPIFFFAFIITLLLLLAHQQQLAFLYITINQMLINSDTKSFSRPPPNYALKFLFYYYNIQIKLNFIFQTRLLFCPVWIVRFIPL